MTAPTQPQRTPDWLLERIALGELPPAELADARSRLLGEPDGAARLDRLLASNDEILGRHPADAFAAVVRARTAAAAAGAGEAAPRRSWSWWLAGLGSAAVAASLLLTLVLPETVGRAPLRPGAGAGRGATGAPVDPAGPRVAVAPVQPGPTERPKGLEPHVVVHRRLGARSERLSPGAVAAAGDLLRVGYISPTTERYGVLCSIDGAGAVTLHLPQEGGVASPLDTDREVLLPFAYELDDAPDYERFVLVTGLRPFGTDEVLVAARSLAQDPARGRQAPLALSDDLHQATYTLRKQP